MSYKLDYSVDGTEWFEDSEDDVDYQNYLSVTQRATKLYEKDYFVNIWDKNDVLVWRDGRLAGIWYQLSPFEQEWMRGFGTMIVRYESTVAFDPETVNL